jgi:excisionase family DNA binding protein
MSTTSELITAREAARRLAITRARISLLISSGELPARKVGRDLIIEVTDLEKINFRPIRRNRLTPEQILELINMAGQGKSISELARHFEVSDRTIYRRLKHS